MGIRKRISQILTPPTGIRARSEEKITQPIPEFGGAAQISKILNHLLIDKTRSSEDVQADLTKLRNIASKYGTYMIACEIQECVSSMPDIDDDGCAYKKGRGFELAADLHRQNLSQHIVALESGKADANSEEYADHIWQLLECFFLANKHRKVIQICMGICEDLILKYCEKSNDIHLYPALAREFSDVILEATLREREKADRIHNRAKRDNHKFDTPMPEDLLYPDGVDDQLLAYIDKFRQTIAYVGPLIKEVKSKAELGAGNAPAKDLEYLESIQSIAKNAQYLPLQACSYKHAGHVMEKVESDAGRDYFKTAARVLEHLGKTERESDLEILSRRHYEAAEGLWLLGGDAISALDAKSIAADLFTS